MKYLLCLIFFVILSSYTFASVSPFTAISFGQFPGRGDFIQVENDDFLDGSTTNLLMEVNGVSSQEIINQTRARYGDQFKCRITEFFPETLTELGIPFRETVTLSVYLLQRGHQIIEVPNVPMTEENLLLLQFDTNFCK